MKFNRDLLQRLLAEFTATAMLVTLGCVTCINEKTYSPRDSLDISTGWGTAVLIPIHVFGFLSGAHINPAVSIAACIVGAMEWQMMLLYILLQFLGSLLGFGLALAVNPYYPYTGEKPVFCVTVPSGSIEHWQAFLVEYCITTILLFAVLAVWDPRSKAALDSVSIRLGLVVAGLCYFAGPHTGCSLNMARTLPPNLIQSQFKSIWVYIVGNLLAAIITPVIWRFVLSDEDTVDEPQPPAPAAQK